MYPCCFPPHHGDPEQARLMSDLRIMIKAEGQSGIPSKCYITSKYPPARLSFPTPCRSPGGGGGGGRHLVNPKFSLRLIVLLCG